MSTIQWNKVTWYSKLIALGLFVALPFIGFYYGTEYGEAVATANQPLPLAAPGSQATSGALPAYYEMPSEWQAHADAQGGFSIAYPIDFPTTESNSPAPRDDWREGAPGGPGLQPFSLTVPKSFEPQTNFSEAKLTVGMSANDKAIAQCMAAEPTGNPSQPATSTATINGITFTVFHLADAGAGNLYETTSYRTLHAGKCYAVEYTVHSNQLLNYPEEYHLQQLDEAKIGSLMQNIIGTFKFL